MNVTTRHPAPVSYTHLDVYKRQEFEPLLPGVVRWVLDMPDHEVTAYLRSTSTRVKSLNAVRLETLEATNPIVAWLRSSCSFDPAAATQVGAKERLTITTGDTGSKTSTVEYKDWDAKLYPCLLYTSRCV